MATSIPSFPPDPKPTTILATPCQATISAPASQVYELIINTSTWKDWNPFVPRVTLHNEPASTSSNTESDGHINSGTKMTFHANISSSKSTSDIPIKVKSMGYISEEKCYRIVWIIEGQYPYWLLNAERKQEIFEIGPESCEYRSWEEMAGWLAYVIAYVTPGRETLKARFRDWADGLKLAAEKRWREEKGR